MTLHLRNRLLKKARHMDWMSPTGKFQLISQQKFLVESLEVLMKDP